MVLPLKSRNTYVVQREFRRHPNGHDFEFESYVRTVSGFNQLAPYNVDTRVYTTTATSEGCTDAGSWSWGPGQGAVFPFNVDKIDLMTENKCYDRLISNIGETAQLGATATAEAKSTYELVVKGLSRFVLSARAVIKLDLKTAARHLGVHPPKEKHRYVAKRVKVGKGRYRKVVRRREYIVLPDGRTVLKTVGNCWLWWSYGVQPLAADVYNAVDILQQEFGWYTIRGSATRAVTRVSNFPGNGTLRYSYKSSCRAKVRIRVINPNLFLANQLGLTNPFQWAIEGIPLSFVWDWFSNLSSVVSSFTNFTGLTTGNPMLTKVQIQTEAGNLIATGPTSKTKSWFSRTVQLPNVSLVFAFEPINWQRGANMAALLLGLLRGTSR